MKHGFKTLLLAGLFEADWLSHASTTDGGG